MALVFVDKDDDDSAYEYSIAVNAPGGGRVVLDPKIKNGGQDKQVQSWLPVKRRPGSCRAFFESAGLRKPTLIEAVERNEIVAILPVDAAASIYRKNNGISFP